VENARTLSRKQRLFECYAANLSACRSDLTDLFACPVCLRLFDREALEAREVTEEHVVPGSLGGRMVTLTCRKCNCTAGSRLESQLVRRLEREDFLAGLTTSPVLGRVLIGEGEIVGAVYRYPDRIELHGMPQITSPQRYAAAVSILRSGVVPGDISLRLRSEYKGLSSWVAVLRMGYLLAFCYFGYEYVLHPSVQQVREQILRPQDQVIPSRAVCSLGEAPQARSILGLLYEPNELRCFFAVLRLKSAVVKYLGVALPGIDAESRHIYDRWGAAPAPIGDLQFKAAFVPFDPEFVCDPGNVGFAYWFWRDHRKPLPTWGTVSRFHYDGSVHSGTDIWYGSKPYRTRVTQEQYRRLMEQFRGRTVALGTSREPPPGSVGAWLQQHVTRRAIACYVGSILVDEGYAERVPSDSTKIRFK
jgi:hypothetical protein